MFTIAIIVVTITFVVLVITEAFYSEHDILGSTMMPGMRGY